MNVTVACFRPPAATLSLCYSVRYYIWRAKIDDAYDIVALTSKSIEHNSHGCSYVNRREKSKLYLEGPGHKHRVSPPVAAPRRHTRQNFTGATSSAIGSGIHYRSDHGIHAQIDTRMKSCHETAKSGDASMAIAENVLTPTGENPP